MRPMRCAGLVGVAMMASCGSSSASIRAEDFMSAMADVPAFFEGRFRQSVQVELPSDTTPGDCRLTARWHGTGSEEGSLGPLAPDFSSTREASWTLEIATESDVIRIESQVTCGARSRPIAARHGGSPPAQVRYCALCGERSTLAPLASGEHDVPGLTLEARVGVSARADGTTVVDTCTGRVLFGVGDVEGARVFGETDLESQYEILFAADHGEDVCARPLVPGSMVVEAPVTRLDELARRVRSVPELRVTLSAPPPPG